MSIAVTQHKNYVGGEWVDAVDGRRRQPSLLRRRSLLSGGEAAAEYMRGYNSMIRREPVGVAGQIAPWNYPLVSERHGGFKQSGYGKDLSMYALEDYTIVKHVMVKL